MQTTLLTLGIAIILALVAALVAPAVIDWNQYRTEIEEQASRIVGAPVRVKGSIDVRILPTPSLTLADVQIGPADSTRKVSARGLAMEFSLGTLMRGEFHANQMTLDQPEMRIGLDRSGALQMPGVALDFDPDRLSIDRLTVNDGRVLLTDAASGAKLAIEGLSVSGEVGSLIGPFKAEGAFTANGEHYAYRVSGSRRGDDGGMKIRLAVDPAERAVDFESEGTVWINGGSPRFEGNATLSRIVGEADPNGKVTINDPWKVSGRIKADTSAVKVDRMEISYGPESRLIRMNGDANLILGGNPRLSGTLTARQIDFDRILPGGEQKRSPFETIKLLVGKLAEAPPPPLPVHLLVGVDTVMAGGSTVSTLRGDVESADDGWILDRLDMRAPGATQIQVNGKLALAADQHKVEFKGPVKVDSNDPGVFFAWIEGHGAADQASFGPMRGSGTVTLGRERVAIDGLKADFDDKTLEGRVAYRFATPAAPARLDAALRGAEIDFDRTIALGRALFASTSFERPGEIALALDIGHASYMGVEARNTQAALTYDRSGLKIERLSIADIAGASVDASGRLDNAANTWRGSINLGLAAPRLDGLTVLADRFLPPSVLSRVSDALHRYGPRIAPLKVSARLDVAPETGAADGRTAAKLTLDGTVAGINVTVEGDGTGEIADPAAAAMLVSGRLDAPDGRALASLVGLDTIANADSHPARMTFVVGGAAEKGFSINGRFTSPELNASASGKMAGAGDGALDVAFRAADTKLPRRTGTVAVPADLHAHLAINGPEVAVTDLSGKIAGSSVNGAVTVGMGEPLRVNGQIDTDQMDAGELLAILTGAPRPAGASPEWVAEPFEQAAAPPMEGRLAFRTATAQWTAGPAARDVAGAITFDPSGFSLTGVTGRVADGRFVLDGQVRRDHGGVSLHSHVKVTNANLPVLLGGVLRVPASGRLSLEAEFRGHGLSPASLVGSLTGSGTLTAENVAVAGLFPNAPDLVLNALENDRGLAGNSTRLTQITNSALDAGKLKIASLTAPIVLADGRAQLSNLKMSTQHTDISGLISVALADWQMNGRFVMTVPVGKNARGVDRPAMTVNVIGPLTAAKRSADVTGLIGWATMRAIDQEAKRLEEAEKERKRMEALVDSMRRRQSGAARQPATVRPPTAGNGLQAGASPAQATVPGSSVKRSASKGSALQGSSPQGSAARGSTAKGSATGYDRRLRPGSAPGAVPEP